MPAQPASTAAPQIWLWDYLGTLEYFKLAALWINRHLDGTLLSNQNTKVDAGAAGIHHGPLNLVSRLPRHIRIIHISCFLDKALSVYL